MLWISHAQSNMEDIEVRHSQQSKVPEGFCSWLSQLQLRNDSHSSLNALFSFRSTYPESDEFYIEYRNESHRSWPFLHSLRLSAVNKLTIHCSMQCKRESFLSVPGRIGKYNVGNRDWEKIIIIDYLIQKTTLY